jgi:hypothetical protein
LTYKTNKNGMYASHEIASKLDRMERSDFTGIKQARIPVVKPVITSGINEVINCFFD